MNIGIRGLLVAGLLASAAGSPALAQRHDDRQDRHAGPQRGGWHEVQASRGHNWRKGQRLGPAQRRYVVNDWNNRGLRAPPRGYRWVRENNNSGDYILVAAATGLIASILASN